MKLFFLFLLSTIMNDYNISEDFRAVINLVHNIYTDFSKFRHIFLLCDFVVSCQICLETFIYNLKKNLLTHCAPLEMCARKSGPGQVAAAAAVIIHTYGARAHAVAAPRIRHRNSAAACDPK